MCWENAICQEGGIAGLFYRVGYGMQLCGRMHKGVVAVQFALCFNRERKKKVAAALAVRNQIV